MSTKAVANERFARLSQQWLNTMGAGLKVDGWAGARTLEAMEQLAPGFSVERLAAELRAQDEERTPPPRPVPSPPGSWSPAPMPPNPNGWPADNPTALQAFYGPRGANLVRARMPYPVFYDGKEMAGGFAVNAKVQESVERVGARVLEVYGAQRIRELRLDQFSGAFNDRPITGGTRPSVHAWAAAIDWWAAENQYRWDHRRAKLAGPEYVAWWEAWEAEGWISLGRLRNFDWMHVQAARIRG
jgi:hypothetical protein